MLRLLLLQILQCGGGGGEINLSFTGLNTKRGVTPRFTGIIERDFTKKQPSTGPPHGFFFCNASSIEQQSILFIFFTCCCARQGPSEVSAPR